jgi:hypothetical protein
MGDDPSLWPQTAAGYPSVDYPPQTARGDGGEGGATATGRWRSGRRGPATGRWRSGRRRAGTGRWRSGRRGPATGRWRSGRRGPATGRWRSGRRRAGCGAEREGRWAGAEGNGELAEPDGAERDAARSARADGPERRGTANWPSRTAPCAAARNDSPSGHALAFERGHRGRATRGASVNQRGLVERAQRGDHDAFAALAGASIARLDAAARLIVRDHDLARDAVQETLVRCWRDLPNPCRASGRPPGRRTAVPCAWRRAPMASTAWHGSPSTAQPPTARHRPRDRLDRGPAAGRR